MTASDQEQPPAPSPPPALDLRRAVLLARACAAAYGKSPEQITAEIGCESVEPFHAGAAVGYTARTGAEVILAFGGTTTPGQEWATALLQWVANLSFAQIDGFGGRVHKGFSQTLDGAWEEVHRQVKVALPAGGQLWVTGHSQGGALAILAAARLTDEHLPPVAVCTFGSPRAGDAAFARSYRPALHRVENGNDVVCHLPPPPAVVAALRPLVQSLVSEKLHWQVPTDVSYEHAGQLIYLGSGQVESPRDADTAQSLSARRLARLLGAAFWDRASLLGDHAIGAYQARLAALIG